MICNLTNWSGRLGNNLIQLSNGLYYSKLNDAQLIIPKHPFLTKTIFNYFYNKDSSKKYNHNFWGINDEEYLINRKDICKNYVHDVLFHRNINQYDTVIHLRGGDIFSLNPPSKYVQAPLSYFRKILDNMNTKNAIIAYEDFKNPIVEILHKDYNIELSTKDLTDDVNLFLNAKNIIMGGISTLPYILSLCSRNIERLYIPLFENLESVYYDKFYTDFEKVYINLKGYIKINEWTYNRDIKKLMFTWN